jgi:hypothetical protein
VICFLGALPRTMEKVYWMSVICEYILQQPTKDTTPLDAVRCQLTCIQLL